MDSPIPQPVLELPNGVLERVAAGSSQAEIDYFIFCITTGKVDAAHAAIIAAGFGVEDADAFVDEVEKLHNDDLQKIQFVQEALKMNDDEMVELANAILRIFS